MYQIPAQIFDSSPRKIALLLLASLVAVGPRASAFDLEHIDIGTTPFMSSGGRFVVFIGSNLIAPSGEVNQAYLYDRDLDALELISQAADGAAADAAVNLPKYVGQRAVSDGGRYVVFQTSASNLPGGSAPGLRQVYVRDRDTATTTLVSKNSAGDPANFTNESGEFSIAPDGWGVLFNSTANNLDALDADNNINTYLHEANGGTTKLACFDRNGDKINDCKKISLSCTGSMVFNSGSATVVSAIDDTHPGIDVFYGIPLNGINTIISVGPGGGPADSLFFSAPSISCDGGRIAFASQAKLAPADTDADWDLYVHDLATGISALLRSPSDTSLRASEVTMSPGGTWLAFRTDAELDEVDNNGTIADAYIISYSRDRVDLGEPQLASQEDSQIGNAASVFPAVGDNGRVGFQSSASNFGPVDGNIDIFVNGCSPVLLELDSSTVADAQTFEACEILVETKTIMPPGELTLRAHRIALGSGFVVETGAGLAVDNL